MLGVTGLHSNQIKSDTENRSKLWSASFNYLIWVFNWISGHILGGIFFLGLIGWLGSLFSATLKIYFIIGLVILGLAAALHQFRLIIFPTPQLTRQVQRKWLSQLHRNTIAFGYGFQLGTGVLTRIKVSTTYLVIGCAFITGSIVLGGIIGGIFGFSRAILPIIFASQNSNPNQSMGFSIKFNSFDGEVQKLNGILAFISSCALIFSVFLK